MNGRPKLQRDPAFWIMTPGEGLFLAGCVLEKVLVKIDSHPGNLSREAAKGRLIFLGDRRAVIDADIGAVGREEKRDGARQTRLAHLLAIDEQRPRAALADTATVIFELVADGVLALRQWLRRTRIHALEAKKVVAVSWHAPAEKQGPAAEATALCDDGAARLGIGYGNLGGDRVRPVLDVQNGVLIQMSHARVQSLRGAPGQQIRSPGNAGNKPLS